MLDKITTPTDLAPKQKLQHQKSAKTNGFLRAKSTAVRQIPVLSNRFIETDRSGSGHYSNALLTCFKQSMRVCVLKATSAPQFANKYVTKYFA